MVEVSYFNHKMHTCFIMGAKRVHYDPSILPNFLISFLHIFDSMTLK